jgi:hypothetical protein
MGGFRNNGSGRPWSLMDTYGKFSYIKLGHTKGLSMCFDVYFNSRLHCSFPHKILNKTALPKTPWPSPIPTLLHPDLTYTRN